MIGCRTDLGLSRNWSHCADFAAFEGIDDTAFTNVRISNETNGDLLFIGMQLGELSEELDQ